MAYELVKMNKNTVAEPDRIAIKYPSVDISEDFS